MSLLPKKRADEHTPLSSASGVSLPERHKDEPTPSRPAPAVVWPGTPEDARLLFSKSDDDGMVRYINLHNFVKSLYCKWTMSSAL